MRDYVCNAPDGRAYSTCMYREERRASFCTGQSRCSAADCLEKAACRVLVVWAGDRREPEDWIAALADLWASVHEYRQNARLDRPETAGGKDCHE